MPPSLNFGHIISNVTKLANLLIMALTKLTKLVNARSQYLSSGLRNAHALGIIIVTPCTCARGKVIGRRRCRRREHKNHHISKPRHLSDSLAQRIGQIWQKNGFSMLQIEGYDPQASQIVPFC